jgi:hypothetical protein
LLTCEECGRRAETPDAARRWRAYLTALDDSGGKGVAVYCPDCADQEFDDSDDDA